MLMSNDEMRPTFLHSSLSLSRKFVCSDQIMCFLTIIEFMSQIFWEFDCLTTFRKGKQIFSRQILTWSLQRKDGAGNTNQYINISLLRASRVLTYSMEGRIELFLNAFLALTQQTDTIALLFLKDRVHELACLSMQHFNILTINRDLLFRKFSGYHCWTYQLLLQNKWFRETLHINTSRNHFNMTYWKQKIAFFKLRSNTMR